LNNNRLEITKNTDFVKNLRFLEDLQAKLRLAKNQPGS
jgi:hypothetical protein